MKTIIPIYTEIDKYILKGSIVINRDYFSDAFAQLLEVAIQKGAVQLDVSVEEKLEENTPEDLADTTPESPAEETPE
jgi:hypothetical protein